MPSEGHKRGKKESFPKEQMVRQMRATETERVVERHLLYFSVVRRAGRRKHRLALGKPGEEGGWREECEPGGLHLGAVR